MKVLLALFVMITAIEAFFWPFTSESESERSSTTTTQRPRTVDPVLERLARVLADHLLLRLSDQKTTTTNSEKDSDFFLHVGAGKMHLFCTWS